MAKPRPGNLFQGGPYCSGLPALPMKIRHHHQRWWSGRGLFSPKPRYRSRGADTGPLHILFLHTTQKKGGAFPDHKRHTAAMAVAPPFA
jgi:hypothetical protein